MDSLTEDLWEMILVRLPLRSSTTYKLVCKKWKSMVESPFFRELFLTHHQNSTTSWSVICTYSPKEVVAYYGCKVWGLSGSLGSYISSFITKKFKTQKQKVRVLAYTDVGLILLGLKTKSKNTTYYVANPMSRECVKIPPRPLRPIEGEERLYRPGLVTRVEKDVILGYKVVLIHDQSNITRGVLSLLVYSSETGKWSFNYLPLAINPFDGNTMYMWSKMHGRFASIDLYKRQLQLHNNCERSISSDGSTLSFPVELDKEKDRLFIPFIPRFVLPRWLYRIPSSPS